MFVKALRTVYHVWYFAALFVVPAYLTSAVWWSQKPVTTSILTLCGIALVFSANVLGDFGLDEPARDAFFGALLLALFACLSTVAIDTCTVLNASKSFTHNGTFVLFTLLMVDCLPGLCNAVLIHMDRSEESDQKVHTAILWLLGNTCIFVCAMLTAQRAISPSGSPPPLFAEMLIVDSFGALLFMGCSLQDGLFWIVLALEVGKQVLRSSGVLEDLLLVAKSGCKCSVQEDEAQDRQKVERLRKKSNFELVNHEIITGKKMTEDRPTTPTSPKSPTTPTTPSTPSSPLGFFVQAWTPRSRLARISQTKEELASAQERLEDSSLAKVRKQQIGYLGSLSIVVATASFLAVLLLEELFQDSRLGQRTITYGIESLDTIKCFAVALGVHLLTVALTFLFQKKSFMYSKPSTVLPLPVLPLGRANSDIDFTDDDRESDVTTFLRTHTSYLVCVTVMVLPNALWYAAYRPRVIADELSGWYGLAL